MFSPFFDHLFCSILPRKKCQVRLLRWRLRRLRPAAGRGLRGGATLGLQGGRGCRATAELRAREKWGWNMGISPWNMGFQHGKMGISVDFMVISPWKMGFPSRKIGIWWWFHHGKWWFHQDRMDKRLVTFMRFMVIETARKITWINGWWSLVIWGG